jgi:hypothetical protein
LIFWAFLIGYYALQKELPAKDNEKEELRCRNSSFLCDPLGAMVQNSYAFELIE